MGATTSSAALGDGNFSAGFAVFGAMIGFLQPASIFKPDELGPFYDWYFPVGSRLAALPLSYRARIVACLELGTGVFLLSKVLQKKPIADRKVPYGLLSGFFLYSIFGHSAVGDDLVPLASFLMICSSSALMATLLQKEDPKKDN